MNEISPDTIKGKRWVGSLYVEEKEPERRRRSRMRGDAVGLGRRPEGVIMLCGGSTFAATVRRRPKVGGQTYRRVQLWEEGAQASESGETFGVGSSGVIRGRLRLIGKRGNELRRVQRSYKRKDVAPLLHSCGKDASEPESSKVQKTRVLINEEWPVWCERDATSKKCERSEHKRSLRVRRQPDDQAGFELVELSTFPREVIDTARELGHRLHEETADKRTMNADALLHRTLLRAAHRLRQVVASKDLVSKESLIKSLKAIRTQLRADIADVRDAANED
ncbi:hypothetical protein Y032_0009g804 [Ancylostoma ceylanicum]|uniref:Uncharacterized protein n=2 Tax=Ancylostoma ceylanicum TaxID=53326 RepID=A0A016VKR2_9BILA|nr:hypothetical protein Y032_0009g804 [Ancylostoma ceylanicum]